VADTGFFICVNAFIIECVKSFTMFTIMQSIGLKIKAVRICQCWHYKCINFKEMKKIINKEQQGFSLIEMLIVIAIIAIVAIVAIPFFGSFVDNRNLKSAARNIAGDIYEYKARASAEDTWYQISYTQATNSYTIAQCNNTGSPCGGYNTLSTKFTTAFGNDIVINNVNFNGASLFQIQPRGLINPTTGGNVQLRNSRGSIVTINVNLMGRTNVVWALQ